MNYNFTFGAEIARARAAHDRDAICNNWAAVDLAHLAAETHWTVDGNIVSVNRALASQHAIACQGGVKILHIQGSALRKVAHAYAASRARLVIGIWEGWAREKAPDHLLTVRHAVEAKEAWCAVQSHDNDDQARWCGEDAYAACLLASRALWSGDESARLPAEAARAAFYASEWRGDCAARYAAESSARALCDDTHDYGHDITLAILEAARATLSMG